ncbi:MAG: peptide ABC transporter ATP-binding protein [Planctomycetes bacterium]|nr:peptide ABC transporter ATP-binding protein [Planctomycetota bacterium]
MTRNTLPMLSVHDLAVRFETPQGPVRAVDRVSFQVERGETLGIVGESGSGKSVTSLAIMGLVPNPPGIVDGGRAFFFEHNLLRLSDKELRAIRGHHIALIFQDPMTSLNPLLTIGRQLTEVLELHKGMSAAEARKHSAAGLGEVGIPDPEASLRSYPHEMSGGMRQRVMIAMALSCRPKLLLADEPTTALDVTIQAQILDLMKDLQEKHGMGIVLITHDLGVVAGMADRIQVMYAGRFVETGPTGELFARPGHPYTQGLLQAVPRLTGAPSSRLATIEGQPPDPMELRPGCAFFERCSYRNAQCERERPELQAFDGPARHACACFARVRVHDGLPPPAPELT